MKLKNALLTITAIVVVVFTFLSCDDEFNSVGNEIIGGVNFEDKLYTAKPIAFNKKFEKVQTNSLTYLTQNNQVAFHANMLGVYKDPIYGQSVYSILSQVQPSQFNPDFGTNAVLDRVVLDLPYFSTPVSTETVDTTLDSGQILRETATKYELDSIYQNSAFKLSVFQSNYFLRDFDPNSSDRQIYYSNDVTNFGAEVQGNGVPLYDTDNFIPSPDEIIVDENLKDVNNEDSLVGRSRLTPRLRVELPVATFKEQFLDKQGSIELSNAANFNNYFRGIYIKAEPVNITGNLLYVNMRGAKITLHYTNDGNTADGETERVQNEFDLSFTNNVINSIKTELDPDIAEELKPENQDQINGEENLYLKGGDGSFAVIDLFSGTIVNENGEDENELEFLKRQNWLINEASFKFYINQDKVITPGGTEPERIYIFNLETGGILADYGLDVGFQLVDETNPLNSIRNHLGRITRESDKAGEFYRIRITQHIINLLNGDIDNIKLGLSVSQNVNSVTSVVGDTANTNDEIIPTSSIISHEGTVLFGNKESVPESKRLKLDIFYTASKNN